MSSDGSPQSGSIWNGCATRDFQNPGSMGGLMFSRYVNRLVLGAMIMLQTKHMFNKKPSRVVY